MNGCARCGATAAELEQISGRVFICVNRALCRGRQMMLQAVRRGQA